MKTACVLAAAMAMAALAGGCATRDDYDGVVMQRDDARIERQKIAEELKTTKEKLELARLDLTAANAGNQAREQKLAEELKQARQAAEPLGQQAAAMAKERDQARSDLQTARQELAAAQEQVIKLQQALADFQKKLAATPIEPASQGAK